MPDSGLSKRTKGRERAENAALITENVLCCFSCSRAKLRTQQEIAREREGERAGSKPGSMVADPNPLRRQAVYVTTCVTYTGGSMVCATSSTLVTVHVGDTVRLTVARLSCSLWFLVTCSYLSTTSHCGRSPPCRHCLLQPGLLDEIQYRAAFAGVFWLFSQTELLRLKVYQHGYPTDAAACIGSWRGTSGEGKMSR